MSFKVSIYLLIKGQIAKFRGTSRRGNNCEFKLMFINILQQQSAIVPRKNATINKANLMRTESENNYALG